MSTVNHLKKELARLQDDFAMADLFGGTSNPFVMKAIVKIHQAIRIRMDGNKNHPRAHLHIDYGREFRTASYAIDTGELLAAKLDRKYDRAVDDWIAICRPLLLQAWELVQTGQSASGVICELRGSDMG
jgi:hypothetical protein